MNKIYKLLSAMILFIAGTMVGQAQYWLVDTSVSDYPNEQEIVEGVDYALENAYTVEYNDFLNGGGKSAVVTDDCLYNFEKAEVDADGNQTWYLKRKSDGKYVKDPNFMLDSESGITYTSARAMAFRFVAKPANWVETSEEATAAEDPFTTYAADGQDSWIFRSVESTADADTYLWANSVGATAAPTFGSTRSANAWKIVTVYEATGYERVYCFLQEKFPNGFQPGSFLVGNDVGCVSNPQALEDMTAAYDQAQILINTASSDEAACTECMNQMNEAYNALIASVIQLEAGYYYLVNWQSNGCVYDSEGNGAKWTASYAIPEKPTVESSAYIWQFIPNDGEWYLRNYKTQNYLGAVTALYTAIPVSDSPAPYQLIPSEGVEDGAGGILSGYFWIGNFTSFAGPVGYNYLHAQLDNNILVYWGNNSGSPKSCWRFTKVDENDLKDLDVQIKQAQIAAAIDELVMTAKTDIASAKSYISDATPDDHLDEMGLVGPGMLSSNATEPSEGSLDALLDGDFGTFFHSMWSTVPDPNDWHYLQAYLGGAYQNLILKYIKRNNFNDDANGTGSPTKVTILSADDPEGPWNEETTLTLSYDYNATYTSSKAGPCDPTELENRVGLASFEMDAPHQYIRFVVKETIGNAKKEGFPYFYWSEFRIYEAEYDAENSLLEIIDKEALQNLYDQMESASAATAAGTATQADLDNLQTAYDKFLEFYPKPEAVSELLTEATTLYEGSYEGEGLGYYQAGSKAELQAVIDAVSPQVKEVMTIEEVNDCRAKLNAAIETFYSKLNTPEAGKVYYIRSLSNSEAVTGHYLFAANSTPGTLQHGGYVQEEGEEIARPDYNIDYDLNYMWTICPAEDGKLTLRNLGTGLYLEGATETSEEVVQAETTTNNFTLRGTPGLAGAFNFVFATGVYLNAEPGEDLVTDSRLVTWGTANADDNSAFEFVEIGMPSMSSVEVGTTNTVITLPYAVYTNAEGDLYQVSGITEDNNLQLVSFENGVVPAGTPFVYIPAENATESNEILMLADNPTTPEDINYNLSPATVNGLVGTLAACEAEAGVGIFIRGMIIAVDSKVNIAANHGYLNGTTPVVAEEGEYSLPVYGTINPETGIGNLDVVNNKARMDVYTISGVKVRSNVSGNEALRNLPAGIYIVGGKKVLVK